MAKRILFIGHDASRTGAPVMFLSFLRWLRAHASFESTLLLLRGGPLVSAYEAVLPTSVLGASAGGKTTVRLRDHLYAIALRLPFRRFLINMRNEIRRSMQARRLRAGNALKGSAAIDLLYCNSVASLNVLHHGIPGNIPLIVHVHEMALGIKYGLHHMKLSDLGGRPVRYIAAGPMVAETLTKTFGIDPAAVSVVYPGIDDIDPSSFVSPAADRRRSLGISADALIVGMAGTVDWRKGADLFVQVAKLVAQRSSKDVHFLWVGGSAEYETFKNEWHAHSGVPEHLISRMHFIGEKSDALSYIAAMDIFALTSREDPFPLVHLEAALLRKPIVCFENAGGAAQWVGDGAAGFVVPYLDTGAFADAVLRLTDDAALRRACGDHARTIVRERYLIDIAARKILHIIEEITAAAFPTVRVPPPLASSHPT